MGKKEEDNPLAVATSFLDAVTDFGLTEHEIIFISNYFQNKNDHKKAYTDTFPEESTSRAASRGLAILGRPQVKEAVKHYLKKRLEGSVMTLENDIVEILKRRMSYDPAMFYDNEGKPIFRLLDEVPEEWRCVIDSIETKAYGKEAIFVTSMKLANKMEAARELAKYIKMSRPEEEKKETDVVDKMATLMDTLVKKIPDSPRPIVVDVEPEKDENEKEEL